MQKPGKLSKYSGNTANIQDYAVQVDKDLVNIFEYILRTPKTYQQSAEPTIGTSEEAYWKDTDDNKFYLIKNIAGTQKKVELT